MGEYFYCLNRTREVKSGFYFLKGKLPNFDTFGFDLKERLPPNFDTFGLISELKNCSENTAQKLFLQIIKDNDWSNTDTICALGASGSEVLYENGKVTGCTGKIPDSYYK